MSVVTVVMMCMVVEFWNQIGLLMLFLKVSRHFLLVN